MHIAPRLGRNPYEVFFKSIGATAMLLKKKPLADEKITFNPKSSMSAAKADKEDAADAKKHGDKQEDAKAKKSKGKSKSKFWAKKAATTLAKGE